MQRDRCLTSSASFSSTFKTDKELKAVRDDATPKRRLDADHLKRIDSFKSPNCTKIGPKLQNLMPCQLKRPINGAILKERRSFSHSEGTFSSPESMRNKVLNEKRSSVNKLKQEIIKKY
jgi:hypothetical protein